MLDATAVFCEGGSIPDALVRPGPAEPTSFLRRHSLFLSITSNSACTLLHIKAHTLSSTRPDSTLIFKAIISSTARKLADSALQRTSLLNLGGRYECAKTLPLDLLSFRQYVPLPQYGSIRYGISTEPIVGYTAQFSSLAAQYCSAT